MGDDEDDDKDEDDGDEDDDGEDDNDDAFHFLYALLRWKEFRCVSFDFCERFSNSPILHYGPE